MQEKLFLYLDMNVFKRSFDDQSTARVRLETAAIDIIFEAVSEGRYALCWSFILEYENSLNPNIERQLATLLLSQYASRIIEPQETIRQRAKELEKRRIQGRDALHLACAEFAGCDYFLTCDDKLLKKGRRQQLSVTVMNPVEFVSYVEDQNGNR